MQTNFHTQVERNSSGESQTGDVCAQGRSGIYTLWIEHTGVKVATQRTEVKLTERGRQNSFRKFKTWKMRRQIFENNLLRGTSPNIIIFKSA